MQTAILSANKHRAVFEPVKGPRVSAHLNNKKDTKKTNWLFWLVLIIVLLIVSAYFLLK